MSVSRTVRVLALVAGLLVAAGVGVFAAAGRQDGPPGEAAGLSGAVRLLALDAEQSIPTWFSAGLIGLCALVAGLLAAGGGPQTRRWSLLAAGLLVLSIDEASAIHEVVPNLLRRTVLPGVDRRVLFLVLVLVALAAAAATVVPLLRSLPRADAARLLVAGGLFVLAGVADVVPRSGPRPLRALLVGAEEGLELFVFLLLLGVLLRAAHRAGIGVRTAA